MKFEFLFIFGDLINYYVIFGGEGGFYRYILGNIWNFVLVRFRMFIGFKDYIDGYFFIF